MGKPVVVHQVSDLEPAFMNFQSSTFTPEKCGRNLGLYFSFLGGMACCFGRNLMRGDLRLIHCRRLAGAAGLVMTKKGS